MKYGYARISDKKQNISRQIKSLEEIGCEEIITDEVSGKDDKRPGFKELMNKVQKGDVIYIHDLDRFMRSTKHLLMVLDELKEKGVALKSIQDKWLDTTEDNPFQDVLITILSSLAEYERKIIKRRQREGYEIAKQRGVHLGRPGRSKQREEKVRQMYEDIISNKRSVRAASDFYGISIATYYRDLDKMGLRED